MKLLTAALLAGSAWAQTIPPVPSLKLPTYIAAGAAFNQLGTPRFNLFTSAIVPLSSSVGLYESTTTNLIPVAKIDPATKRTVYTVQAQIRQGLHKTLYTGSNVQALVGGDAGLGASAVASGGLTLNLAGSITGTFVYQFNAHWAAIMPVRAIYSASLGGWYLVPEAGIVWKP